jgi:hypothetical protein
MLGDVHYRCREPLGRGFETAKSKTFNFFSIFLKFFLIYEEILNFLSLVKKTKDPPYAYAFPPDAFPPPSNSNFPAPS